MISCWESFETDMAMNLANKTVFLNFYSLPQVSKYPQSVSGDIWRNTTLNRLPSPSGESHKQVNYTSRCRNYYFGCSSTCDANLRYYHVAHAMPLDDVFFKFCWLSLRMQITIKARFISTASSRRMSTQEEQQNVETGFWLLIDCLLEWSHKCHARRGGDESQVPIAKSNSWAIFCVHLYPSSNRVPRRRWSGRKVLQCKHLFLYSARSSSRISTKWIVLRLCQKLSFHLPDSSRVHLKKTKTGHSVSSRMKGNIEDLVAQKLKKETQQ